MRVVIFTHLITTPLGNSFWSQVFFSPSFEKTRDPDSRFFVLSKHRSVSQKLFFIIFYVFTMLMRVVIFTHLITTPLGNSFCAFHHE